MNNQILFQGDCLELMQQIPDKSVDMILCDLPYGTTACKWDVIIPFDKLWIQYERIIKDNGAIVLFGAEPFSSHLRLSNLKMYKYDWIWDKVKPSGFQLAKFQPMRRTENISVFGHKTIYNPQKVPRDKPVKSKVYSGSSSNALQGGFNSDFEKVYVDKNPQNVLVYSNADNTNRVHPTQKPVALLEYLIKTYTNTNELVLDNTMGSGSTGVACVNTLRDFIGIEKDEKYFAIAEDRIAKAVKDLELKVVEENKVVA